MELVKAIALIGLASVLIGFPIYYLGNQIFREHSNGWAWWGGGIIQSALVGLLFVLFWSSLSEHKLADYVFSGIAVVAWVLCFYFIAVCKRSLKQ